METRPGRRERVVSLDIMRGLIMVVMALDHTRDFWSNAQIDPTDAERTTVAYFATRWVTHLCAPWFMVLAGVGASLSLARGRDKASLTRFLLTRGLWLIALELTIVNLGWQGSMFDPSFTRWMILCALGSSMIALAGLIHLPRWTILVVAAAMIVGHDASNRIDPADLGALSWLWKLLHSPGVIGAQPSHGASLFVLYPVIPWIGVIALGYCAGPWLVSLEPRRRARTFAMLGGALLAVFAIVRGLDVYGDPRPWHGFDTTARTVMSFFELSKYPPSLDFLLATLGVGALVLAVIEWSSRARPWRVFKTFGSVPMFYYLAHIPLIMVSCELANRIVLGTWRDEVGVHLGYGLPVIYALWLAYVAALYPLCKWFERVKATRRDWWLGYL